MNDTTRKTTGALTVLLAVFGGAALLGTGTTAAFAGVQQFGEQSGSLRADARGVTSLDLEVSAADVRVEFQEGETRAQLRIEHGSSAGWSLTRDGDELKVQGPRRGFDWFRPDWIGGDWFRGDERATLVLPGSLKGLDADLTLNAGSLSADGVFGELDVDLNAGALSVSGEARTLDAQLNAGRADIDLGGVRMAEYTVNAGRVDATLRSAPESVEVDVSAGQLELTVPDADYDLRRQVSAGTLRSSLSESGSSAHLIEVTVTAGTVTLRPSGGDD